MIVLITGCGTAEIGRQYEFIEPNVKVHSHLGYLKIFTHSYYEKGDYPEDPSLLTYKGHTIISKDGNYVLDVKKTHDAPPLIKLGAGTYIVSAELKEHVVYSFQTLIEQGKILEIDKSMIDYRGSKNQN